MDWPEWWTGGCQSTTITHVERCCSCCLGLPSRTHGIGIARHGSGQAPVGSNGVYSGSTHTYIGLADPVELSRL